MSNHALSTVTETLQVSMSPEQARASLAQLQKYVNVYLLDNIDYGVQPGTDKKTLFKSGAEKLNELYSLEPHYEFLVEPKELWEATPPLFDYTFKCVIFNRKGQIVGTGVGNCNSYESKYKWRTAGRKCPSCGVEALGESKAEWGGGFYCNAKRGGCGTSWKEFSTKKYSPSEEEILQVKTIREQPQGRVFNEDIASQKNTILKMAKKRALVDATICATRSSGLFTQDVSDPEIEASGVPKPTPEAWIELRKKAIDRGATAEQVKAFTTKLQSEKVPLSQIYKQAEKHFLGEDDNDGLDWEDLSDRFDSCADIVDAE